MTETSQSNGTRTKKTSAELEADFRREQAEQKAKEAEYWEMLRRPLDDSPWPNPCKRKNTRPPPADKIRAKSRNPFTNYDPHDPVRSVGFADPYDDAPAEPRPRSKPKIARRHPAGKRGTTRKTGRDYSTEDHIKVRVVGRDEEDFIDRKLLSHWHGDVVELSKMLLDVNERRLRGRYLNGNELETHIPKLYEAVRNLRPQPDGMHDVPPECRRALAQWIVTQYCRFAESSCDPALEPRKVCGNPPLIFRKVSIVDGGLKLRRYLVPEIIGALEEFGWLAYNPNIRVKSAELTPDDGAWDCVISYERRKGIDHVAVARQLLQQLAGVMHSQGVHRMSSSKATALLAPKRGERWLGNTTRPVLPAKLIRFSDGIGRGYRLKDVEAALAAAIQHNHTTEPAHVPAPASRRFVYDPDVADMVPA